MNWEKERNMEQELSADEIKKILVEILVVVDRFCRENKLIYFLTGGTLLGAVRHKGFIPWDDDIDIAMPRESYERLLRTFNRNRKDHYRIIDVSNTKNYYLQFAKVIDNQTVWHEEFAKAIDIGVYVDIFPLDYIGSDYAKAKALNKQTEFYRKLLRAKVYGWYGTRKWYRNLMAMSFSVLPISTKTIIKKIDKLSRSYEKDSNSKYAAVMVFMAYGEREIMESKWFSKIIELPFENHTFCAPAEYDSVLESLYGDYMELPPLKKRVTHHFFRAYRKEIQK